MYSWKNANRFLSWGPWQCPCEVYLHGLICWMFGNMGVMTLALEENMSYFICRVVGGIIHLESHNFSTTMPRYHHHCHHNSCESITRLSSVDNNNNECLYWFWGATLLWSARWGGGWTHSIFGAGECSGNRFNDYSAWVATINCIRSRLQKCKKEKHPYSFHQESQTIWVVVMKLNCSWPKCSSINPLLNWMLVTTRKFYC